MIFSHKDYLTYELPNDWRSEEREDNLLIFNPNGEGAITISFFNILEMRETLDEHISIMAKNFVDQNRITLHNPLILYGTEEYKAQLYLVGHLSLIRVVCVAALHQAESHEHLQDVTRVLVG